jgi:hypothetical protein
MDARPKIRGIGIAVTPLVLALLLLGAAASQPADAQQPAAQAVAVCPTPEARGGAEVCVDRGEGSIYAVGDPIRICYDIPGPGRVTMTDILADGTSHVLLSVHDDGAGGCFDAVVTPPAGTECLRLDYATNAGSGSTQTCFQVVGSGDNPGPAFIRTDRSEYRAGDTIRICFSFPGPGPFTVRSRLLGGDSHVVLDGYEDASGVCFVSTLGPEVGINCLRLELV